MFVNDCVMLYGLLVLCVGLVCVRVILLCFWCACWIAVSGVVSYGLSFVRAVFVCVLVYVCLCGLFVLYGLRLYNLLCFV